MPSRMIGATPTISPAPRSTGCAPPSPRPAESRAPEAARMPEPAKPIDASPERGKVNNAVYAPAAPSAQPLAQPLPPAAAGHPAGRDRLRAGEARRSVASDAARRDSVRGRSTFAPTGMRAGRLPRRWCPAAKSMLQCGGAALKRFRCRGAVQCVMAGLDPQIHFFKKMDARSSPRMTNAGSHKAESLQPLLSRCSFCSRLGILAVVDAVAEFPPPCSPRRCCRDIARQACHGVVEYPPFMMSSTRCIGSVSRNARRQTKN